MEKNVKLIIFAVIFQIPILLLMIGATADAPDITGLIAGNSFIDLLYWFLLSPLIMILFIFLFTVILARLFFKLHKIMKLKRFNYAILKNVEGEINFRSMLNRAIILGLFAFSIGIFMTQFIDRNIILIVRGNNLLVVMTATLFILPYLIVIVIPVWLLRDTGIVCSRKKMKEGSRQLPDIEGVYRDFHGIIKGYVGISTIFAIVLLVVENFIIDWNPSDWLLAIILMIFTPFLSIAISIVPIMFYEWRLEKNRDALIKNLQKRNIIFIEDISEL